LRVAVIGLGRMGANISRRLMRGGHEVVGFDRDQESVRKLAGEGIDGAASLDDVVSKLAAPRIFWVMLPAGGPTEETVAALAAKSQQGDVIIDGGNTFFKDDIRRSSECAAKGVHYVDVGTSGGVWGLERGYCLMIGGDKPVVDMLDPIFDTLAPGYGTIPRTRGRVGSDDRAERGYIHAGPAGAGHFVKMVHNGIEYGLMQAYAEGFDLLRGRASERLPEDQRFEINLPNVAEVWRRGSVISSWLLDLCAIEPQTFLLDEWRRLVKTLNVVDAFGDVVAVVRMYDLEDRLADQILSRRRTPKTYCRRIEISELTFLVNDDRIRRELNQTTITLFALFQRLLHAMSLDELRDFHQQLFISEWKIEIVVGACVQAFDTGIV